MPQRLDVEYCQGCGGELLFPHCPSAGPDDYLCDECVAEEEGQG